MEGGKSEWQITVMLYAMWKAATHGTPKYLHSSLNLFPISPDSPPLSAEFPHCTEKSAVICSRWMFAVSVGRFSQLFSRFCNAQSHINNKHWQTHPACRGLCMDRTKDTCVRTGQFRPWVGLCPRVHTSNRTRCRSRGWPEAEHTGSSPQTARGHGEHWHRMHHTLVETGMGRKRTDRSMVKTMDLPSSLRT